MSLPILVMLVVFGIGGGVLAIHLTGGSVPARLSSPEQAFARFAEDFPDLAASEIVLSESGNAAFLHFLSGEAGLVHVIGDRFITRKLGRPDVLACAAKGRDLSLTLDDFTFPGGVWHFAGAADATRIAGWLNEARGA